MDEKDLSPAIRALFDVHIGALDSQFLSQSISCLDLNEPLSVNQDESIDAVMMRFRKHKSGCAVVINETGRLVGIFSERDYVLRVYGNVENTAETPVSEFMTRDPVTQNPDATMSHVLNLMSNGGFRHIPIVDEQHKPIWLVSVKNIVDHIVEGVTDSLLNFETTLDDDELEE